MRLKYSKLCAILGVPCNSDFTDTEITSYSIDTRTLEKGALFIAIAGQNTDGHLFCKDALARGASCILAEKDIPKQDCAGFETVPILVVPNTGKALQKIAAYARSQTKAKVIGLTGTCGKTSVKEMLASIFSCVGKTAKTEKNYNNQLGMSLGILNSDGDEDFWVFEVGISHDGDMEELGSILRPDIALIINAAVGHTEGLGEKGVAWHKAQLLTYMQDTGIGIVSADYPELVWKALGTHRENLFFFSAKKGEISGQTPKACRESQNFAKWLGDGCDGFGRYRICVEGNECEVQAPVSAAFFAENVIAAALCAYKAGVDLTTIALGIRKYTRVEHRFQRKDIGSITILDDTYNANPLSMQAMLSDAKLLAQKKACPLVLLLGDMRELGALATPEHKKLGKEIASVAPKAVFFRGEFASCVFESASQAGYTGIFYTVSNADEFMQHWRSLEKAFLENGSLVFVAKGSHSNALETFVKVLCDFLEEGCHVL